MVRFYNPTVLLKPKCCVFRASETVQPRRGFKHCRNHCFGGPGTKMALGVELSGHWTGPSYPIIDYSDIYIYTHISYNCEAMTSDFTVRMWRTHARASFVLMSDDF